jgi:hypothetical protein
MARNTETRTSSRRPIVNEDWYEEPRTRRASREEVVQEQPRRGRPPVVEQRPVKRLELETASQKRKRLMEESNEPRTRRASREEVVQEQPRRGRPARHVEPEPVAEDYTPREGSAAQIAIDLLSTKAARKNGVDFEEIMEALGYDPQYENHRVSARVVLYKLKAKGFDLENVGRRSAPAYRINN